MPKYWCRPVGIHPESWHIDPDNRVFAAFHLEQIEYGFDETLIGRLRFTVVWRLSGPAILLRPLQVRNTQLMLSTTCKSYILAGGRTMNRCKDGEYTATPADELIQWRCTLYDNSAFKHESVVEVQWRVVGYPGYWFFFVKSPTAYSEDKQFYLFNADRPPELPFGSGHA